MNHLIVNNPKRRFPSQETVKFFAERYNVYPLGWNSWIAGGRVFDRCTESRGTSNDSHENLKCAIARVVGMRIARKEKEEQKERQCLRGRIE